MQNLGNRLFLCYAWEDLAEVQRFAEAIMHDLSVSFDFYKGEENLEVLEDKVFPLIDEAEIMLVFVSDTSKKSPFVKECVVHAQHLNKRILPVELSKNSIFVPMPDEFKFRTKPVNIKNEDERSRLFSQLKAALGLSVVGGDNFGSLIHVYTDQNVKVSRYGKELCRAIVGQPCSFRLVKGSHKLDISNLDNTSEAYSISYEVKSNDAEQYLNVTFRKKMEEIARKKLEEQKREEERSKPMSTGANLGILGAILAIVFAAVYGYNYYNDIYLPEKIDREAARLYVLPNSLFIRSSKMTDISNKQASVYFGQELIVYENDGEWSRVKYKKAGQKGKEGITGYVMSTYLVNKSDLYLLRSILGNEEAKAVAETSKCRRALINYYKENGYIGRMSAEERAEVGIRIVPGSDNQWQFFPLDKKSKYNHAFFKKLFDPNQEYKDACLILTNIMTRERKLVIFRYDDDETPHFVGEMPVPPTGLIKTIKVERKRDEIFFTPVFIDE